MTLFKTGRIALAVALLAGCASLIQDRESQLSAAGFIVRPADSPERQAQLAKLPANRVSQQIRGQTVSYLYPDPVVCKCLYVGSQQAFARYQQALQQQRVAADQLQAAQLNTDWDWGPWGGFGPGFGGGFGGGYGGGFGPGFYP